MVIRRPELEYGQRLATSTSLLNDLFQHTIDDGYAEAAARRKAAGSPASSGDKPRKSPALMLGLLILGLLLTIAALQVQQDAGVVSAERESLVEQIHTASERTAELEHEVSAAQADVVELEGRALQSASDGAALQESMLAARAVVGTAEVTGPGVVVELNNAEPGTATGSDSDPRLLTVLDYDLQQVINGLWAAGAEAVSVNGERITPTTGIRSVDDVILVNIRPIGAPYVVSAIGAAETLAQDFFDGPGGRFLTDIASQFGIQFSIESRESLTLPGGAASLEVAQP